MCGKPEIPSTIWHRASVQWHGFEDWGKGSSWILKSKVQNHHHHHQKWWPLMLALFIITHHHHHHPHHEQQHHHDCHHKSPPVASSWPFSWLCMVNLGTSQNIIDNMLIRLPEILMLKVIFHPFLQALSSCHFHRMNTGHEIRTAAQEMGNCNYKVRRKQQNTNWEILILFVAIGGSLSSQYKWFSQTPSLCKLPKACSKCHLLHAWSRNAEWFFISKHNSGAVFSF